MIFSLSKNPLYSKEGDPAYVAHTRMVGQMTKAQVLERLAHGSTLTEADINAVLSGLEKILVDYIVMGLRIDIGFITLSHSIKGGFDSPDDFFRKDRNWISVNANMNAAFVNSVNQLAKPTRVRPLGKAPEPLKITKLLGDMALNEFQSGDIVRISGSKLSFDQNDNDAGVYLLSETGIPVRVNEYAKKSDASILLKMPEGLTSGSNLVEVRSRTPNGTIVKGILDTPVMIAA